LTVTERVFNVSLGLSAISWAVAGILTAEEGDAVTLVRLVTSGLNLCVGVLFLLRAPAVRHGSVASVALSIPGVVAAGLALRLAPAPSLWPFCSAVLFALGGLLAVVSFVSLGRSFAVLPAVRRTVSAGPYAIVRHPAYLGELLLVLACFTARPGLWAAIPLTLAVPLVALRILAEEKVLSGSEDYRRYRERVERRLIPFLW